MWAGIFATGGNSKGGAHRIVSPDVRKAVSRFVRLCVRPAAVLVLTAGAAPAQTLSLLHFDGANGSKSMVDDFGYTWTPAGNTALSTATAQTGQSVYFDGNGDHLTVGSSDAFKFGAAAFTIDFWLRPDTAANAYLLGRDNPDRGAGFDLRILNGGIAVVGLNGWGINLTSASGSVQAGVWQHVALVADTTTTRLFINGSLQGTTGRSVITDGGNSFRIGGQRDFNGNAYAGYLDELRISGTALWSTDFAVGALPGVPEPSAYAAIGGVLALGYAAYRRRKRR